MNHRLSFLLAAGGALLLTGCYEYQPPSEVLLGTKFLPANRTATDKVLTELNVLPLKEAKKIAEINNQNYQAVFHNVNAARMRYFQSLGAYAPEIHLGSQTGQDLNWANNEFNPPMNVAGREVAFQVNNTVTASWLMFDGFARYLNVLIRKADWKREKAVRMRVLCMLKRSVAYSYYDVQLAKEIQRIQTDNIRFQNRLFGIVSPEVADGKRPPDEKLNFSVLAGVGQYTRLAAVNQQEVADYSLALLMGYSEGKLPGTVEIEPIAKKLDRMYYDVDMCIDIALQNNPEMHIMREQLRIARYSKFKSYSTYFPTVYADFGYRNSLMKSSYENYRYAGSSFGQNSLSYGFRADLLLFDGLARYNAMREMQTLYAVAEFNMAETYLQLINNIRAAYSNYETAYKQFAVYQNLLPEALEQRDLVLNRYLRYSASVDRMDKVQQYYVDIQTSCAAASTEFNKAVAQLEALMMIDVYSGKIYEEWEKDE